MSAPSTVGTPPDLRHFWRVLLAVVAPVTAPAIAVSTLLTPYPMQGEFAAVREGPDRRTMLALNEAVC